MTVGPNHARTQTSSETSAFAEFPLMRAELTPSVSIPLTVTTPGVLSAVTKRVTFDVTGDVGSKDVINLLCLAHCHSWDRRSHMGDQTWPERMRKDRLAGGMSHRELARAIIATSPAFSGYSEDSVERTVKRWESGSVGLPRPGAQEAIARVFGSVTAAYFPSPVGLVERGLSKDATADVIAHLRRFSVDGSTLDLARLAVEQLCVSYASEPGPVVLAEASRWLVEIERVRREGRLRLRQLTEVYDLAGWLSLLVACLRHDTGDDRGAETMRRMAALLGRDLGSPDIRGWSDEIAAWMALSRGDWRGVLAAVRNGLASAGTSPVAVQLHAQAAKAWARIGSRAEVAASLDRGRELLERSPLPPNAQNHFVVDPAKWDFYVMDCARRVGDDVLASTLADAVIKNSTTASGLVIAPMRLAEAQLTQAAVAARSGDRDQAMATAVAALERDRKSLPSLILVGQEIADLVDGHPGALDFRQHLAELRRAG
jgi:transcriptional regulator with XRE-family HTH domain